MGEQRPWTATQVRALAVTGLSSSHLQPFTRLLYNDPKRSRGDGRSRAVLVESSATGDEVICRRHRERHGKYTATWLSSTDPVQSGELFNVHAAVDCVELQLWNRFDNGFDVFLGKASISLHQLQQQCSAASLHTETMSTAALWFPLQVSEGSGLSSQLSVQVECVFVSDPTVLRIREAIRRRRKKTSRGVKKAKRKQFHEKDVIDDQQDVLGSENEENQSDEHADNSIADPAFAFTQPCFPVEWSRIAGTSIRKLFFHAEVERLADFRELVLYGDLAKELDDDEDLQIHDDHLTAFNLCQFSAQYLDHCVESLSQRVQDYSDEYHVLVDTRAQFTRKNRSLRTQRRRLQKEHDDLDLLITTYQRVLEKNGGEKLPTEKMRPPSSPHQGTPAAPESVLESPPASPTNSISSKKPVFLKTWEERERERHLEKEITKAQRIKEEKQRLNQRVLERQQRDDYEEFSAKSIERQKQRAAKTIQAFFRELMVKLNAQRRVETERAATLVQSAWKRFIHMKKSPHRLEMLKQKQEMVFMARNEQEIRIWMAGIARKQQEEEMAATASPSEVTQGEAVKEACGSASPSPSPSKEVVDALVATWRRLHRVFVVAHTTRGIDYSELFSQIDLRKDDVLDRAELRLGARSFGVRLDRQITRALIALIRTKCGAPSKPLLVTFAQFMQGFELEQKTIVNKSPLDAQPDTYDTRSQIPTTTGAKESGKSEDQGNSDEALVVAVRAFRKTVYEFAMTRLVASGKSPTDYRAFRDALTHMFRDIDVDSDGQLDVDELVTCMESFNLQLNSENVSLLRELFVGDHESDTIGVAEFISFVLAHSASKSEHYDDGELGLLGYRLREAILTRVRQAQAQTQAESVEEAVRIVFAAAYKRKDQQNCPIRDFVHTLRRLRLGMTPAQLALLVVRLDRDGDHTISFEELLIWLQIRAKGQHSSSVDECLLGSGHLTASQSALQLAMNKAKVLRLLLGKIAGDATSPDSKKTSLTTLFRQIDENDSGKINEEELQTFLERHDLSAIVGEDALAQLCGLSPLPQHPATLVAKEMMELLDLNANGVATLQEWLTFTRHDTEDDDDPVVIEAIRKALKYSENDDPECLVLWFSGLPGAMQAAPTRPGVPAQIKIRVGEFKNALRAKLGGARFISLHAIDCAVENLDKDASGWITTSELNAWAFPPRDLEEILRLVIKSWQIERLREPNRTEFAANLYSRFDADGNGSLAVRELILGFVSFGVRLTEYEARVLMVAFDLDADGCWSKMEFLAFVDKLLPADPLETPTTGTHAQVATNAEPRTNELPARSDSEYSDDNLFLQSGASSMLASSNEDNTDVRPVEYSEDFDMDE